LWNDGRAEVAVYDSEVLINQKPRTFREHLIVLREELRSDTLTKPEKDNPGPLVDVFELRDVQHFDTDNYPRGVLTQVFVSDDNLQQVIKAIRSSQDWDENSFKVLKNSPDGMESTLLTYGSGEASQPTELAFGKDAYIDEQLPVSLRNLAFKDGFTQNIKLWNVLSSTTSADLYPKAIAATLSVSGPEDVRCRAGVLPCWRVSVKKTTGEDLYWFEKAEPHLLVKMIAADGRKRLLAGRARWSFWDRRIPQPNVLN
jgi:hypothetical protein